MMMSHPKSYYHDYGEDVDQTGYYFYYTIAMMMSRPKSCPFSFGEFLYYCHNVDESLQVLPSHGEDVD